MTRWIGTDRHPSSGEAAIVILTDPHGRVLLQLRDDFPGVANGGLWSFFGGGLEPGETAAAAAVREIGEEVGITLHADQLRPFATYVSQAGLRPLVHVFRCLGTVSSHEIRLAEGAGFGFFSADQIAHLNGSASLKPVLEAYFSEAYKESATDSADDTV